MRRADFAVAAVALLATACGTTVNGNDAMGSAEAGLSAPTLGGTPNGDAGAAPLAAGTGGSAAGAAAAGGLASAGPTATTPTGRVRPSGAAPTVPAGIDGPGVTDKTISIGIDYRTNTDAANAAIGASGITSGDEKSDAQAVIDDINAHGGAAGRKLVPVWHATDAQSQQTRATQDQEMCADFTQDHRVFAAAAVGYTDNFLACMSRAGVIDVDSGVLIGPDNATFRQFPSYFELGTISQDRADAELVRSLIRQRYFVGWNPSLGRPGADPVKVGVLGVDLPEWTRPVRSVLLPALKAAGYAVDPGDVRMIYNPGSASEDGVTLRDISSAALRFRQDRVTHVILLDTGGNLIAFFGQAANSQHYYPRYGVHSGSGLQAIYDSGLVTARELNGALGLSWDPVIDLSAAAADKYKNASTRHCLKVIKQRTGQTFTSTNAAGLALGYCDQLYFLADAINRAGPVINRDTVIAAIEATRFGFLPAGFPSSFFGPGRHDGVETGWDEKWFSDCKCVRYVSKPFRIP